MFWARAAPEVLFLAHSLVNPSDNIDFSALTFPEGRRNASITCKNGDDFFRALWVD